MEKEVAMRRTSQFLMLAVLFLLPSISQGAFKFVAWADNRPGTIDTVPSTGTNRARYQWMLQEMNRLIVQPSDSMAPEWHIVPGDFDETETTEEDLYLSGVTAWAFAPGNHDLAELQQANTSWDHENVHFVFLNEYCCGDGRICNHVYNWLVEDLSKNTQPAIFVIGHEPAFPENAHIGDSLDADRDERNRFWQLLSDYGVLAYICGHTHWFSTESVDGVLQIDVGNAGNPVHGEPHQTFVVFDVTADNVYIDVYWGNENQPYAWTDDLYVLPIPEPVYTAHHPSPTHNATSVSINTTLRWVQGSGATAHNVYFGAAESGLTFIQNQAETVYTPTLDFEMPYVWCIDEVYPDGTVVPGDHVSPWTFTTGPAAIDVPATGETSIDGIVTVDGSVPLDGYGYTATFLSDGSYEEITEVRNVPNKNAYNLLEHIWTFDVPAGLSVKFYVEAHRSASTDDDFEFSFSTDGYTYHYMLSVTEVDDIEPSFALPSSTAGTVYIKATDTDHTRKNPDCDTLFVDFMRIESSQIAQPGTVTVSVVTSTQRVNPPDAYGIATITVLDESGNPVSGAFVSGYFTGEFTDDFTDVGAIETNVDGQAVFRTSDDLKKPIFRFVVKSVADADGTQIWP